MRNLRSKIWNLTKGAAAAIGATFLIGLVMKATGIGAEYVSDFMDVIGDFLRNSSDAILSIFGGGGAEQSADLDRQGMDELIATVQSAEPSGAGPQPGEWEYMNGRGEVVETGPAEILPDGTVVNPDTGTHVEETCAPGDDTWCARPAG